MVNLVKIGGADIDTDDPCALWQALYAIKLKRLSGAQVEETEIRSPVTHRRLRSATVSMADLDAELERLAAACQAKSGGGRSRFAKRIRFI